MHLEQPLAASLGGSLGAVCRAWSADVNRYDGAKAAEAQCRFPAHDCEVTTGAGVTGAGWVAVELVPVSSSFWLLLP